MFICTRVEPEPLVLRRFPGLGLFSQHKVSRSQAVTSDYPRRYINMFIKVGHVLKCRPRSMIEAGVA